MYNICMGINSLLTVYWYWHHVFRVNNFLLSLVVDTQGQQ